MRLWFPTSPIGAPQLPNALNIHLEGGAGPNSEQLIQKLLLLNPILSEDKVFHAASYYSHGFSSLQWGLVWRNPGVQEPASCAWKVVAMYDHMGTQVSTARGRNNFYSRIVKGPVNVSLNSSVNLCGISRTGSPPPLIPIRKKSYGNDFLP